MTYSVLRLMKTIKNPQVKQYYLNCLQKYDMAHDWWGLLYENGTFQQCRIY